MTIETLLIVGALAGLIVGMAIPNAKLGCAALFIVPVAMIAYVYVWQGTHPERLRSTSGLDFIFGPLWPSLGAMGGYLVGTALRYHVLSNRDDG